MVYPPQSDKRHFRRIQFSARCHVHLVGQKWPCEMIDISLKGVLLDVTGLNTAKPGDLGKLEMRLDAGDAIINMDIKISHITEQRIGARCELIDADSMTHLRRLVELNLGDEALLHRELAQLMAGDIK